MNQVILLGNLTRDPEIHTLPTGNAIVTFGIAINRKWKDPAGNPKEEVTFVEITAFAKLGEVFAQYHKKGGRAMVMGRLKLDTWEDKTSGQNRSKLYVVMESFEFVNSRRSDDGTGGSPQRMPSNRLAPQTLKPDAGDDIPF